MESQIHVDVLFIGFTDDFDFDEQASNLLSLMHQLGFDPKQSIRALMRFRDQWQPKFIISTPSLSQANDLIDQAQELGINCRLVQPEEFSLEQISWLRDFLAGPAVRRNDKDS